MIFIYFSIAVIATIVGSFVGLGGGVIIKPLLDLISTYDIKTIGILSSFTVFFMSIISISKHLKNKRSINYTIAVLVSLGSILGGYIGDRIFDLYRNFLSQNTLANIQNLILALLLSLIFIYMNNKSAFKSYKITNHFFIAFVGFLLGSISAFLSIGGGPINICVFALFFSMNEKDAAVYSIITILFSQGSKLLTTGLNYGFSYLNFNVLFAMILGGILGGLIGSNLNIKLNNSNILNVINITLILLITLNIFNLIIHN